ncbi:hypothetical protein FQN49_003011 [Arthroderma sp. PD_2]|nr:hypothetical protein FQN49_003011 [Arthroderma sp. PD_2]
MASNTTVVLITGANRGIGKGLLETYLARPNHTVIGTVRDLKTSSNLSELPKNPSSSLIIVKIDSAYEADPFAAVRELESDHGISSLDIVVANAAILKGFPKVEAVTSASMGEHYQVNVIGPVLLFQAVLPLMQKAFMPKFVTISSSAGSIGEMEQRPFPNAAYGPTKASLNYLTRKIHLEHEDIIAVPIDPGWPESDMGNFAAATFGLPAAELTVADSVQGLIAVYSPLAKALQRSNYKNKVTVFANPRTKRHSYTTLEPSTTNTRLL